VSENMQLNCQLSIPEVEGLTSNQLTVGRHFIFLCNGDTGSFDFAKAQLVTEPANKYDFALIHATPNQSQPGITFSMVSYVTGEIQTTDLKISDSRNEITLKIQPIKVESVLAPPEKTAEGTVKPQEPFGYNVLNLNWPHAYTAFFVIVFCAIIAGLVTQGLRTRRFRRLANELKDYDSAIDPDSQFYKHVRLLEKKNYPIKDVERQFHIYVIRRYQVPLFGLSTGETTSYLKKTWPTLVNERRDLKNILSDLKKMSLKENPAETKKYLTKLYQFVDHSEEKIGGLS
jgi:hypothetical protein